MAANINMINLEILLTNIIKTAIKECITEIKSNESGNLNIDLFTRVTLTIKMASEYSGINEEKIRQLVHTQDFPCFKNGNKWLINRELLDEWLIKVSKEHRQI